MVPSLQNHLIRANGPLGDRFISAIQVRIVSTLGESDTAWACNRAEFAISAEANTQQNTFMDISSITELGAVSCRNLATPILLSNCQLPKFFRK